MRRIVPQRQLRRYLRQDLASRRFPTALAFCEALTRFYRRQDFYRLLIHHCSQTTRPPADNPQSPSTQLPRVDSCPPHFSICEMKVLSSIATLMAALQLASAGIVITPIRSDMVVEKDSGDCFFGVVTPMGCG